MKTIRISKKLHSDISRFANLTGLKDYQALEALLPDVADLLSASRPNGSEEIEWLATSAWQYSKAELQAMRRRLKSL